MSEFAYKRSQRVAHLLQQELSQILLEGLKDPRVGFVTVTEVRASDDLRTARVFVSIYGNADERAASLAGLRDAAGFIRRELGHRVRLRYVPELAFAEDTSLERAQRIETLMDAINHGETDVPPPSTTPDAVPVDTARSALAASARSFDERRAAAPRKRGKSARRAGHGRRTKHKAR